MIKKYGPFLALRIPFIPTVFMTTSIEGSLFFFSSFFFFFTFLPPILFYKDYYAPPPIAIKQVLSGSTTEFPKSKRYEAAEGLVGRGLVSI